MPVETPLSGMTALVTGGGRGIGRATALALAEFGAAVAVTARSRDQIAEVADLIRSQGGCAVAVAGDITSFGDCERIVADTESQLGPVSILINNAGGGALVDRIVDTNPVEWAQVIEQNLTGTYFMCRAALPGMTARRTGTIVNIGSGAGRSVTTGGSAYGAAKAGLAHFTSSLAAEVWRDGIDVNEVVPGPVATELTHGMFAEGETPRLAGSERVKPPEEVAELVTWLVTRPAGGPTGQVFSLARRHLG